MADNFTYKDASLATGTGAADEVTDGTLGTVKVPYVKLMDGALDGTTKYGETTALPVRHLDTAPATQNITAADVVSATATGQNSQSIITGTPTANSAATFTVAGLDTVNIQITGTWSATLASEVSFDGGTTWYTRGIHQAGTNYSAASFTGNAAGGLNAGGVTNVRVRCTAYTSGTATVRISGSTNPALFYLVNSAKISDGTVPTQQLGIDSSGKVTINSASTAGGSTTYSFLSTAAVQAAQIKGSAGQVYGMSFFNNTSTICYVRLYNQTGTPANTDTANIVWRGMIPANTNASGFVIPMPEGVAFGTGIGIRVTAAVADNDNTALAANAIMGNLRWK